MVEQSWGRGVQPRGLRGSRGGMHSGLGWRGAGVGPREVIAAGDDSQCDALGAGFSVHVAAVIVGEAIGGAGKTGLLLAAVSAFAHWLAIPDVTFRALLQTHEMVACGLLGHAHRALLPLHIHVAGRHAALGPTHVGAALLISLTLLGRARCRGLSKEEKEESMGFPHLPPWFTGKGTNRCSLIMRKSF